MIFTEVEQEKLFRLVKARYPTWDIKQASGYVHGVLDGLTRSTPRRVYLRLFEDKRAYATGYLYGFVSAYGRDALVAPWITLLDRQDIMTNFDYRWWEHAPKTTPGNRQSKNS